MELEDAKETLENGVEFGLPDSSWNDTHREDDGKGDGEKAIKCRNNLRTKEKEDCTEESDPI